MSNSLYLFVFVTIFSLVYFIFIKPRTFRLVKIIPFVILLCFTIFWEARWTYNKKKFITNEVSSKVIKSFSLGNGIVEFKLENNFRVEFSPNRFFIVVGDSIVKKSNSSFFFVYRKDYTGKYVLFKEYDYEE